MATYNRVDSWYTDSTYNADENYENSPFATDPRTFPAARTSLSSTAVSQPYAMIPLPNQFALYTIEEMMNQEEDIEPCLASKKRQAESLAVKNGDLIEKSLKSRLLQQQESNRKKNCEFQQIRASLEIVHSLVHLIHDDRCNKTWIEFSTDEFKIPPNVKNMKLSKYEKEGTLFPTDGGESLSKDEVEPETPTRISVSCVRSDSVGPARSFKAMSITAHVPTTPTKAARATAAPTPTSEIYNLYLHGQSTEDISSVADLATHEETAPPSKAQESYYKTQLSRFNLEKSAALLNDPGVPADYKNSPGNLSITSIAVTMSTVHDDEWNQLDDSTTVHASESTSNGGRSEDSSFRKMSIGPNQSRTMSMKFKKLTSAESTL